MAINPNHIVEEIKGTRCSVVEKNVLHERATYIRDILEKSGYAVIASENADSTLNIGVTDVTFNLQHALYGRILKTSNGKLVTPAIWNQKSQDKGFYWEY